MPLSRRDLIKAGVFAGAAVRCRCPVVSGQSVVDNRMPASKLPKPFTTPFAIPPVAVPVRSDATTDYYSMSTTATKIEIVPGFQTMFFAYNGVAPGPTIKVDQGREAVVRHRNTLPGVHPTLGYKPWTSVHLHGSASLPQNSTDTPATSPIQASSRTTSYPNFQPRGRSGTTTTASITPPRTYITGSLPSTT